MASFGRALRRGSGAHAMSNQFFDDPILNSPYERPTRHWETDEFGQPTQNVCNSRRGADFFTPIPQPRKRAGGARQATLGLGDEAGLSTRDQTYDAMGIINGVRAEVDKWRALPKSQWKVTPETARLLEYWRSHEFSGKRPFYCQIEAVETAIWLTEVAPQLPKNTNAFRYDEFLKDSNAEANSELNRLALKLATGSGKTTVMAMIIAWQTINASRRRQSKKFTRGFLVVAPGITIKDRLRVLQPNDPDNYYEHRELVPIDMLPDIQKAKIVVTNFHVFNLREKGDVSPGTKRLLQGLGGEEPQTRESEGEMLRRVARELMGFRNIVVINDEAHHCYREKPVGQSQEKSYKGEELQEAKSNREAARIWISGLEAAHRCLGVQRVFDLSATPFFLRGSGYAEGTLFPWTVYDFSLMDAIECGVVKLPRVPVADNVPGNEMPVYRELWKHIGKKMPKKGRSGKTAGDPSALPVELQSALDILYGHYAKVFAQWKEAGVKTPPCFVVVCNNTATSKLVCDYISGYWSTGAEGEGDFVPGRLELFRNFDSFGQPLARPNTLLIDSEQLEAGEPLSDAFKSAAAGQIERFRCEMIERSGDAQAADNLSDEDLLRETMNTVGKEGRLGESVRCVVSVSMLSEGWDASNVTHILGVRAFGTQLLCEQVVGRALRRRSYDLNEKGMFNVEYADVLGVPFDFAAQPALAPAKPPAESIHVCAVSPERDALEIRFPRVVGYRTELPGDKLTARFTEDSRLRLTPEMAGPSRVLQSGIVGRSEVLDLSAANGLRDNTVMMRLTWRLLESKFRDIDGAPKSYLFGQLKHIVELWFEQCLECSGGTRPSQLLYGELTEKACERIAAAITLAQEEKGASARAIFDPFNPEGTTKGVAFNTSKKLFATSSDPAKCHINYAALDSDWEAEFCRAAESHPKVLAYVKNDHLGFEAPYRLDGETHRYIPDFIVKIDDGRGAADPLNLVVEVKGRPDLEDAKAKKRTMENYWVPGVNNSGRFGRWAFAQFDDVFAMQDGLDAASQPALLADKAKESFERMIRGAQNKDCEA